LGEAWLMKGGHGEPVEPWWEGLCARVFDKLRLTGLFYIPYCAVSATCHPEERRIYPHADSGFLL